MPKRRPNDNPELEYIRYVRGLWLVDQFPHTYADDLMPVMLEAGFIIDAVKSSLSNDNVVVWIGTCYDEDLVTYGFTATWEFNRTLFHKSVPHFFELADLAIEVVQ